jgi:hypothetical protein
MITGTVGAGVVAVGVAHPSIFSRPFLGCLHPFRGEPLPEIAIVLVTPDGDRFSPRHRKHPVETVSEYCSRPFCSGSLLEAGVVSHSSFTITWSLEGAAVFVPLFVAFWMSLSAARWGFGDGLHPGAGDGVDDWARAVV